MSSSSALKGATFAALLLVSSCAGPGTQGKGASGPAAPGDKPGDAKAVAATDPGKKLVCTFEADVGSHIPQKVCRKQEDIDAARDRATEWMEQSRGQGSPALPGK